MSGRRLAVTTAAATAARAVWRLQLEVHWSYILVALSDRTPVRAPGVECRSSGLLQQMGYV